MPNRNYNSNSVPAAFSPLTSSTIRTEFAAIEAGFAGIEAELDERVVPGAGSSSNVPNLTVVRDEFGNFAANVITAYLNGAAASVKSPATTGVTTFQGPAAGTTRIITVPDANVTMACAAQAGTAAASTVTPRYLGDEYIKTDTRTIYKAVGLTANDWVDLSGGTF